MGDPLAHLARGLVGEGDDQQVPGLGPAGGEDVGEAGGEDAGLAGAGPGQHQDRTVDTLHGQPLFGVQSGQIVAGFATRRAGAGEVGNPGSGQVGHGRRCSGSVGSGEGDV